MRCQCISASYQDSARCTVLMDHVTIKSPRPSALFPRTIQDSRTSVKINDWKDIIMRQAIMRCQCISASYQDSATCTVLMDHVNIKSPDPPRFSHVQYKIVTQVLQLMIGKILL